MYKFLFILFFIGNCFCLQAQEATAEIFSPRIKNNPGGSSFYFRVLNANEAEFKAIVEKSKLFESLKNYKDGYSAEYKTGSIYFSSTSYIGLNQISELMKFLGLNTILFDGKKITADDVKSQPIIQVERQSVNNKSNR